MLISILSTPCSIHTQYMISLLQLQQQQRREQQTMEDQQNKRQTFIGYKHLILYKYNHNNNDKEVKKKKKNNQQYDDNCYCRHQCFLSLRTFALYNQLASVVAAVATARYHFTSRSATSHMN